MTDLAILLKLRFSNFLRLNELKHGGDKKLKNRIIGSIVAYVFVALMLEFYLVALCVSLAAIGSATLILPTVYAISSMAILMFSIFRAGGVIYEHASFDILIPMPLKKSAIVAERFLSMYFEELAFSALFMVTAFVVTALSLSSAITPIFVAIFIVATITLPVLPLTLSTIFGSIIAAISARLKHKSLVKTIISLVFVLAVMALSFSSGSIDDEVSAEIFQTISAAISHLFVAAAFGNALYGEPLLFLLIVLGEMVLLTAVILVIGKFFVKICSAMRESCANMSFKKTAIKQNSTFKAFLKLNLKQYFSSSVYVTNTIIGPILLLAASILSIFFGGYVTEIFEQTGLSKALVTIIPLWVLTLAPTTTAAISMEGKNFYIMRILPIREKDFYNAKLAVNLVINLPSYVISAILLPIFLKVEWANVPAFILIPLGGLLLATVFGLKLNQKNVNFAWKSEAEIVKSGLPVLLAMLVSFVTVIVAGALVLCLEFSALAAIIFFALAMLVSSFVYRSVLKVPLSTLN